MNWHGLGRRDFLRISGAMASSGLAWAAVSPPPALRKMTIDLVCGAIGVKADPWQAIDLAARHGFESVGPDGGAIAKMSDSQIAELTDRLRSKGLVFGAAGLPVDFRRDEKAFQEGLQELRGIAKGLRKAGVTRMGTWISPSHKELTYLQNFRQHVGRLGAIASVLEDYGIRLGLEYVGPKTSWSASRYPFIHSMAEMKDLLGDLGRTNLGFVLDSWHWYTAGETQTDLLSLSNQDVVAVDLNDAPEGIPVDQQVDSKRHLPATTGVIDVATFLGSLAQIGYDGPVRSEPFDETLRTLPADEAVARTARAMKAAFAALS